MVSSEGLCLLAWDDRTTRNNLSHNTSNSFYAKGEWGNVDEKKIFCFFGGLSTEDTTLNGSTVGDGLVWVYTSVGFFTVEEVFDKLLNLGDTG